MKEIKNLKDFIYFPCKKNSKKPATRRGFKDAKICDIASLRRKGNNIGFPMRLNGLIAIDVDEKDGKTGIADLQMLVKEYGVLPYTLKQKSCNGAGFHLIFWDDGICENSRGDLSESIDIRWNAYILCAPSTINGKNYKFVEGIDEFGNVTIAKLPPKWIELINGNNTSEPSIKTNYSKVANTFKAFIIQDCNLIKVFKSCRFLQYCLKESRTLKETIWFSMIALLARAKGCEKLIHALSSPYPKYSYEETESKIRRVKESGKYQTCHYISTKYPNICGNCCSSNKRKGGKNGRSK